ncbi:hypothetical protein [Nitrosomonas sp. ANs5]|uniref:hypothetical protein n=1 Tax=Nitrosomonas sp. ANs5 TaxID=3423941 RepID=UPI003D333B5D
MKTKKAIVPVMVGFAFVATLSVAPIVSATENPFGAQPMEKSYEVAEYHQNSGKQTGEGKRGKRGENRNGAAPADRNKDDSSNRDETEKMRMKDDREGRDMQNGDDDSSKGLLDRDNSSINTQ